MIFMVNPSVPKLNKSLYLLNDFQVYGLINNDSEDKDAKQEKEDFDSKVLTLFENIQQKIVKALNVSGIKRRKYDESG